MQTPAIATLLLLFLISLNIVTAKAKAEDNAVQADLAQPMFSLREVASLLQTRDNRD